jgi:hypothetical protein
LGGPNLNHRDDDARDGDRIWVIPVHHRRPPPNNRQPNHDEFSDDNDYAERVFSWNIGADQRGGGHGGASRGGARFKGNVNGNARYRRAYEEQPMHWDYGREESREYRMKIDLPSFNEHLHIEDFLDWVTEVEKFFDYLSIPEERKMKLVACKLKGGASAWLCSTR